MAIARGQTLFPNAYMVGKGAFPNGQRVYHFVQPVSEDEANNNSKDKKFVQHNNTQCEVLATIAANKSIIFGASCRPDLRIQDVCPPLLERALEDSGADGEQPRAMAALYGLCDWVKDCLEGKAKSKALEKLRENATTRFCKPLRQSPLEYPGPVILW